MATEDCGQGQDRAAAEHSASITYSPAYWVEMLDGDGQVVRKWHTVRSF